MDIQNLDERAKLIMAVSAGICGLAAVLWQTQALCLAFSLVLCAFSGARIFAAVFPGLLVLVLAAVFGVKHIWDRSTLAGMGLVFMMLKFGPFFAGMVFLYKTVNTARLMRVLAKTGVPAQVLVPLGVSLRFMPSFAREFGHIRDAMAFRGMDLTALAFIRRPLATLEFILIPLLMRSLIIGEELSRAALARGITSPQPASSFYRIAFGKRDFAWSGLWTLAMVLILVLDRGGLQ